MNENTYKHFTSVLRSINYYSKRSPLVQYTQTQFTAWAQNHNTEINEIKKTHVNFEFARVRDITYEYFTYHVNNAKALTPQQIYFLEKMDEQDLFAHHDNLSDIKDVLTNATPAAMTTATTTVSGVSSQMSTLRISSKINIDKLSGSEEEIEDWFDDFERLAENWSDVLMGSRLPSYLSESALLVYKNMKLDKTCYKTIKDAIIANLVIKEENEYLNKFLQRKQKESESVTSFKLNLERLADKSNLDAATRESTLLKRFWIGLVPEIQKIVLSNTPANMDAALTLAKKAELLLEKARTEKEIPLRQINASPHSSRREQRRTSRSHSRSSSYGRDKRSQASKSPQDRHQRKRTPSTTYGKQREPIRCHKCNKTGHIARYCRVGGKGTSQMKCYNCDGYGHIAKECKKKKSFIGLNLDDETDNSATIVAVKVNGVKVNAILDSGAVSTDYQLLF